jgi:2-polyprenyl-6-methoxyphenol hydroxylase-like FAD-dependent oxidoreductase
MGAGRSGARQNLRHQRHGALLLLKPRAVIIGGSLGGLFAANLLHDLGWEVEVFERVPDDLAVRGAGIGTHEELVAALARLGIAMDERLGIKAGDRICVDRTGNERYRIPWGHTMSAWASVYRPLKDRLPAARYHFGKAFRKLEEQGNQVVAQFDDGSEARGDLLIGADGLRSAVRAQLFPGLEPAYASYVAWRGIIDESALSPAARQWLGNDYWLVLPPGEQMLSYRVPAKGAGSLSGRADWNYVWYRPVTADALRDLCTDATGRHHGSAMPPPLIRPDVTARIKHAASTLLAPHVSEMVQRSQPFFQAIFDVESPSIVRRRVCLLGDAAFVARPHVGMGVTKAALDALCLAKSIAGSPDDLDGALARYARLREEFGRRCVARGRYLGSYIEARAHPERPWTAAQLDERPERVLHEFAAYLSDIPELALDI